MPSVVAEALRREEHCRLPRGPHCRPGARHCRAQQRHQRGKCSVGRCCGGVGGGRNAALERCRRDLPYILHAFPRRLSDVRLEPRGKRWCVRHPFGRHRRAKRLCQLFQSRNQRGQQVAQVVLVEDTIRRAVLLGLHLTQEIRECHGRGSEDGGSAWCTRHVGHCMKHPTQKRQREPLAHHVPRLASPLVVLRPCSPDRVCQAREGHVSVCNWPCHHRRQVLIRLWQVAQMVFQVVEHAAHAGEERVRRRRSTRARGHAADKCTRRRPVHLPLLEPFQHQLLHKSRNTQGESSPGVHCPDRFAHVLVLEKVS
mmetsp:Transcript_3208/g.5137  ORF Transcript_3208/g.5137 Transcript_3208/m.5137 type:complete len:312 (+) Transcript_3208:1146-2081(+)